MLENLRAADIYLFRLINGHWTHPALDAFFAFVTEFKYMMPLVAVVLAAGFWRGDAKERFGIGQALLCVLLADMVGATIKDLAGRQRPFEVVQGIRVLVGLSQSYSFPSNHAINSAVAALVLGVTWRRRPVVAVGGCLLALCVAYSRVYVGVHYPLDVLGGIALGLTVGALVLAVTSRWPVVRPVPGAPWKGLSAIVIVVSFLWRLCLAAQVKRNLTPAEALTWAGSVSPGFEGEPVAWAFRMLMRALDTAADSGQFVFHMTVAVASTAVLILFHMMGRAVTGGHRGGFFALTFAASLPLWNVGSALQLPAVWSVLLVVVLWYAALYALREDRTILWWPAAAAAAAAALFSPFAAAAASGLALGLALDGATGRRRSITGAATTAVLACVVAAVTVTLDRDAAPHTSNTFRDLLDGMVLGCLPLLVLLLAALSLRMTGTPAHGMALRRLLVAGLPPLAAAVASAVRGGDVFTPLAMTCVPAVLVAACWMEALGDVTTPRGQRILRASAGAVAMALGFALSVLLVSPDTRRPWLWLVPPQRDPAGLMLGWRNLARKVDSLGARSWGNTPWRVKADNKEVAALLRFYSAQPQRVAAPGSPLPPGPVIYVFESGLTETLKNRFPEAASCGEPNTHACKSKWRIYRTLTLLPCVH